MADIAEMFNLALWYQQHGNPAQAESLYRQIIQADRAHADAHNNLGMILYGKGQLADAVFCFQQAIFSNPNYVDAHYNLGIALFGQGEPARAAECFRQALRIDPNYADAQDNLGVFFQGQGQLDDALACHRRALSINPHHAAAHNNLGSALYKKGALAEAGACYRQALRLNPNHADALNNLGVVFQVQGQLDEAIDYHRQALAINPNHTDAHNNLGVALSGLQDFAGAAECYRQALRINPTDARANFNLGKLRFLQGDFEGGWPGYEYRWFLSGIVPPAFPQPRWDGSPLEGKTILLHAEQGLGDTIQFIRYAELVKERGGRVLVACQPPLVRSLAGVAGVDQIVPQDKPLPAFDVQIPLMSLGGIFQTALATIPGKVPYVRAEADQVERWRGELAALDGFKVGIVWQGSPAQTDDRERSVPLAQFAPLAKVPGIRLVSLQVGPGIEQLAQAPFAVTDLGSRFDPNSLHDLAAVLANLDLVVTVCTSVAHLAGAMGVPGLVALRIVPHWFWLLDRSDSPWYPTLRLFRQRKHGAWGDVFERLAVEVARMSGRS